ncbi:hypothetical protein J3454_06985 [Erythrobacter sp. NFXS35]|uniref:hypothetical protein n=1 Tax=Erythrobacter sp. NFXS35 TaxID=2818436 RepID=UPI0032DE7D7E
MAADRRSTADEITAALLWAVIGGALIGGLGLTLWMIVQSGGQRLLEEPLALIFGPIGVGAFSLFVVAPCTILFGLISAALINHLLLSRPAALAVCIITATTTQVACVRVMFWQEWHEPADFLFTTPFALGAAFVLWWRLTREKRT